MTVSDTAEIRISCEATSWGGVVCEFDIVADTLPTTRAELLARVPGDYRKNTTSVICIGHVRRVLIVHMEDIEVPSSLA